MNAMNRWTIRALLALILIGVGYSAWRMRAQTDPLHWWSDAQSAIDRGEFSTARLHLQNLLARVPDHAAGHLALARLELQIAKAADESASWANCPAGLAHLGEATRLRPADLALQTEALEVYRKLRRMPEASAIAERILVQQPENVDALFSAAFGAVEARQSPRAEARLSALKRATKRPIFQTLVLSAKWADDAGQPEQLQAALAEAVETIQSLPAAAIVALPRAEQLALYDLAVIAVDRAVDAEAAHERGQRLFAALAQWSAAAEAQPAETPTVSRGKLAELADRIARSVTSRRASAAGDGSREPGEPANADLEQIRRLAIEAGQAGPAIYLPLAQVAFASGEVTAARNWVSKGLVAAKKQGLSKSPEALRLRLLAAKQLVGAGDGAAAQEHLEALQSDPEFAGWAHLLSGNLAINENRATAALLEFRLAEKQLGQTIQVRAALAHTHLLLGQWSEALERLAGLAAAYPTLTAADQQWLEKNGDTLARLHFDQFRAHLALGQWNEAQTHLTALEGNALEPRAYVLAVNFLWNARQPNKAQAWLAEARRAFPADLELAWVEATLLERLGQVDRARECLTRFVAQNAGDVPSTLLASRWRMEHGEANAAAAAIAALAGRKDITPQELEAITLFESQALLAAGRIDEALAKVQPLRANAELSTAASLVAAAAAARQQDWAAVDAALQSAGSGRDRTVGLFQGEIAAARGNYATALDALTPALDISALRQRAAASLYRAIDTMAQAEGLSAALVKAQSLVQSYPRDTILLAILADLQFRGGQPDAAWATLDSLEQVDSTTAVPSYLRAMAWRSLGQPARALQETQQALRKDAGHVPTLLLAAEISLASGDPQGALAPIGRAVKANSRCWWAYLLQAEALNRLQRGDEALRVLTALVHAQPQLPAAQVALVGTLAARGRMEEALATVRSARAAMPSDATVLAAEIGILCRTNRIEEALRAAEAALGVSDDVDVRLAVAEAFAGTGHWTEALDWTERALHADANSAAAHMLAGRSSLALGQGGKNEMLAAARDHFYAVVQRQPGNLLAANNLAWLLADRFGRVEEALRVAEAARGGATVAQLPVEFADTIALVYRRAGRWKEAAAVIDEALALHPQEPRLQFQLGLFFVARNETVKAREALLRALELGLSGPAADEAQALLGQLDSVGQQASRQR